MNPTRRGFSTHPERRVVQARACVSPQAVPRSRSGVQVGVMSVIVLRVPVGILSGQILTEARRPLCGRAVRQSAPTLLPWTGEVHAVTRVILERASVFSPAGFSQNSASQRLPTFVHRRPEGPVETNEAESGAGPPLRMRSLGELPHCHGHKSTKGLRTTPAYSLGRLRLTVPSGLVSAG